MIKRTATMIFLIICLIFFAYLPDTALADNVIKNVGDSFQLAGHTEIFQGYPSYSWWISDTSVVQAVSSTSGSDTCTFRGLKAGTCRITLSSVFTYNSGNEERYSYSWTVEIKAKITPTQTPQPTSQTGQCGSSAEWRFDSNTGELTISGTGAIYDYNDGKTPSWFDYRFQIQSVIVKDGITHIGDKVFSDCFCMSSVTIPDSVTSIGSHAFNGCKALIDVFIPDSVTSIGNNVFLNCTRLSGIRVGRNNPNYSSVNDVLFNKEKTTLIRFPEAKTGSYIIPNSVTSIEELAFIYCKNLTGISIPGTVSRIGKRAFDNCYGLTNVFIPGSVNKIEYGTFRCCEALVNVIISNGVTEIGNKAFEHCIKMESVSIPNSVTSIGDNAFEYCIMLKSVCIPSSVTSIGKYAFQECQSLTSLSIPNGVTIIDDYAFQKCLGLTNVSIPNSVITIGLSAFEKCYGLTSISLPFVGKSRDARGSDGLLCYLFGPNSESETSVKQYTRSGYWCRYIPTSLKSIVITDASQINYGAFSNCSMLESVVIPSCVTSIENKAFYGCNKLTIEVEGGSYAHKFAVNNSIPYHINASFIQWSFILPASLTSIAPQAFAFTAVQAVRIPDCCLSIEEKAFYNSGLRHIYIPDSVTFINPTAFEGVQSLNIYGKPGSCAETFAKKFGYEFGSD